MVFFIWLGKGKGVGFPPPFFFVVVGLDWIALLYRERKEIG